MDYVMFKLSFNYDDEFDVNGMAILTIKEFNQFVEKVTLFEQGTFWFGTNECVNFESREELLNAIDLQGLSEEECQILEKFNLNNIGHARSFIRFVIENENEALWKG